MSVSCKCFVCLFIYFHFCQSSFTGKKKQGITQNCSSCWRTVRWSNRERPAVVCVHSCSLYIILSYHNITIKTLRPNTKTLFFNFNSTSNHSSWANLSKQWQKTAGVKKYHIRWLKALKQKWKVNDNYQCKPASSEQAHYYSCSLIWPYFGTHLSKTLMCL